MRGREGVRNRMGGGGGGGVEWRGWEFEGEVRENKVSNCTV